MNKFVLTVPLFAAFLFASSANVFAEQTGVPIEINADHFEFMQEENKVKVEGNVILIREKTTLTCDKAVIDRNTGIAVAEGNVVLSSEVGGEISGEKMTFNFENMTGEFMGAKINSAPYYGEGETLSKVGENHIVMDKGHITTCDLRKPHYKLRSQKIDIYPGDKAVARNMRFIVGKTPVLYVPRYSQVINDKKPRVIYTPGYDKQWGAFLLQAWRYYFNENFKGTIHLDYRERKDFASGVDLDYKIPKGGTGIIRTYYMLERPITSKYTWQERPSPTPEHERFKGEWRHKWDIDDRTNAVWQYYRYSDVNFLKDYFKREYEKDREPQTFFVLTHALPSGILSFRNDVRVNRFVGAVDRLPEIGYDVTNQQLGETGVYLRNKTTYSNLVSRDISPTELRRKTMRLDTDNELSYPMKVGFVEFRPFVGGRETYYSRTKEPADDGTIRGLFKTGSDLSTKFYKVFDIDTKFWGVEVHRLRHVITPTVSYLFTTDPTLASSQLNSFDAVDSLTRTHSITFSLENKLQTKREEVSVDLVRAIVSSDFLLKEQVGTGGFNNIKTDFEVKPADWLTFNADTDYSSLRDKLISSNFDIYLHDPDTDKKRWSFGLGKRYSLDVDDQITTSWEYVINPKWKAGLYNRFDIDHGIHKEQEYRITRDLHCWEMDINFNETRGQGSEIWIVFRLKAFPELGFDMGTSFNRRKAGSQSSEGL